MTLYDSGNNQRTSGGDQLAVTIIADVGGAPAAGVEIFDQEDGTYIVVYEIFDTSSLYTVSVTTNADSANIKTSSLTVVSNLTSPAVSEFSSGDLAWPTTAAATIIDLEETYSFLTDLKDAYGNPINERSQALLTEIEGMGQKVYSTAALVDLSIGRYETSFLVPTSADRSSSLCGSYTVHQFLVESGGLNASYFANKWFSPHDSPFLTQIDELVNFHWGSETDLIPGIAREYVSIEWVGYLMPGETGDFYFRTEANDGVRLFVDDELLVDSFTDVADGDVRTNTSVAGAALESGKLVPIKVQYYQSLGSAMVALYWAPPSASGQTFSVIPTTNLYHKNNTEAITARTMVLSTQYTPQMPTGLF